METPPKQAPDHFVGTEPWDLYLDEKAIHNKEEGFQSHLPAIIQALLSSKQGEAVDAAKRAAELIRSDYMELYLPSIPMERVQDDKSMGSYLSSFYELILGAAKLVNYEDYQQDLLVLLLQELRKTSKPVQFTISGRTHTAFFDDPFFGSTTKDRWNGFIPEDPPTIKDYETQQVLQAQCDIWVDFSAFLARCTAAGLYDHYEDGFKYPCTDVPLGLEKDPAAQPLVTGTRVLVAALWITHAAGRIRQSLADVNIDKWNPQKWDTWRARLLDIKLKGIPNLEVEEEGKVYDQVCSALYAMDHVDAGYSELNL
nr:uncharacterized protein CTRU02_02213 [Colletotrichum truncatum]KAF6799342.1 hypothetical protein CTRU02_02213 [Colletotrichum truncatum]